MYKLLYASVDHLFVTTASTETLSRTIVCVTASSSPPCPKSYTQHRTD